MDILEQMDSWKRVAGYTGSGGEFTISVHDAETKQVMQQIVSKLNDVVTALTGIRARLDGGIKTQAGVISVTV